MNEDDNRQLENLTAINLDDMLVSFGLEKSRLGRRIVGAIFRAPARKFARQFIDWDWEIEHLGLQEGSRHILSNFARGGVRVQGQENIPDSGPLLVLSNHPGMADTLALFVSLPRPDLRVVAAERPFLHALPALARLMIYVAEHGESRTQVLYQTIDALQGGGSILTFPAGEIEPDPGVLPGAVDSLGNWSQSIAILVRKVPQMKIVGAVVSHVLAPQATFHPLTRLRRSQKDRERLGASIQYIANTLFPKIWPVTVDVAFTPALAAAELAPLHEPQAITRAVTDFIRPYVEAASTART